VQFFGVEEYMSSIKVSEVVFRDDLYPRIDTDPALVQRYAENLEVLPPIEVNQHNELIDGWHRWTAHRKNEKETIEVIVTQTASEKEFLEMAIIRNAIHGAQLSNKDKRQMARRLYDPKAKNGEDGAKEHISGLLSVPKRTLAGWLNDIDKTEREERKQRIYDMWLACYTQEEIAEEEGIDKASANRQIESLLQKGEMAKTQQTLATFQDEEFTVPLYNVWRFSGISNKVAHFGNSEQTILENLLYLYTEPFDMVLDPFAGGGSTIDVCKKRSRRYWTSDRKPIVERENEIRNLDICADLPPLHNRWSDVKLIYLDPPYWRQAQNKYSEDGADLSNMPLEEFTDRLAGIIRQLAEKAPGATIAMLMQPTQWNADNRQYTDHITDIIQCAGLSVENRVSCPYTSEQCNAQMVQWAKDNKKLLVISRELVIWRRQ
jgi:hypothetical protein